MERYVVMQKKYYKKALKEIKKGEKETHWMWYIFPQIYGLGQSEISQYYGLRGIEEAKEYLKNRYLRKNLNRICRVLLKLKINNADKVFGSIDSMKLKSSMTIFYVARNKENNIYQKVLEKYFEGKFDKNTLKMIYYK